MDEVLAAVIQLETLYLLPWVLMGCRVFMTGYIQVLIKRENKNCMFKYRA